MQRGGAALLIAHHTSHLSGRQKEARLMADCSFFIAVWNLKDPKVHMMCVWSGRQLESKWQPCQRSLHFFLNNSTINWLWTKCQPTGLLLQRLVALWLSLCWQSCWFHTVCHIIIMFTRRYQTKSRQYQRIQVGSLCSADPRQLRLTLGKYYWYK